MVAVSSNDPRSKLRGIKEKKEFQSARSKLRGIHHPTVNKFSCQFGKPIAFSLMPILRQINY